MLHVYRQITGQQTVEPWVFTHKREGEARFPFPKKRLTVLPKPRLRWWRRWVSKNIRRSPWRLHAWEVRHALLELTRAEARLLHIYFGHTAVHFLPLIQAFPRPVVVSFHGADTGVGLEKPRHLAALREVFTHASLIQARAQSLADDLAALGCPPEKIRLQRTGIPLEEWVFDRRQPPADGAWKLLQSCRFIKKKGLDLTVRAFAEVVKRHPHARLTLAGDGPLRQNLEELADALGVKEAIRFTGFLDQAQLRQEMQSAHFFLHPSRTTEDGNREGVPNAMLEAMASGAPVLATTHGGIPEAVVAGESGILVAENDADGLAKGLIHLIEHPGEAQVLAMRARLRIEQLFDRVMNIRLLEETYLGLIDAKLV